MTVWRLTAPVRGRLVAGVACQAAGSLAGVVPVVAVAELGRLLVGGAPAGQVWLAAGMGAVALAVRVVLFTAATALTHWADGDLQLLLRRRMARRLGRLPLGWFDERGSGVVKRAVADDVAALHHIVGHAVLDLTAAVVVPVGAVAYLLSVDPLLTGITVLPLLAGLVLHHGAMRRSRRHMGEYFAATERLDAAVVEFVQGMQVVKVFGQAGKAHRRFRDAATDYGHFVRDWARSITPLSGWSQVAHSSAVALLVVLAGGTALVTSGHLAAVDVLPFLLLGPGLSQPALAIGYALQDIRLGVTAAGRIENLLDTPALPEPAAPRRPTEPFVVELDAVRFGYDERHEVLCGVDLTLAPGTITALVGPSGSGKSTLAGLVARFHDVTSGAIRIGGVDIRSIPTDVLYTYVGFVLQDVRLLRASVLDNLRLAQPGASVAQVHDAARAAAVHDRIMALPRGYDTMLDDGIQLSGGEAQRLSIARALLADAPIMLLDEATAFADPDSEAAVQEALSELARGRTVLVIAHRLSTVVNVDQIAVLDNGIVVEQGRHDRLLAADGRYARLWRAQRAGAEGRVA